MKIELHRTKKIDEADDIQDGNGETNASQDINQPKENHENNVDTSEYNSKISQLSNLKMAKRTQYSQELKVINDQIALLHQNKTRIAANPVDNDEQKTSVKNELVKINGQIAELLYRKLQKKITYQNAVRDIEGQICTLYKEYAKAGGDVDVKAVDESYRGSYRFSKKLYEAVINRTDEMYGILMMAIDGIDYLTYRPESAKCREYAKNIIASLRLIEDSDDMAKLFRDNLYGMLTRSKNAPYTSNDKDKIVNAVVDEMKKNTMFSWIFANEK